MNLCHFDAQAARARVFDAPFKIEHLSFNKLWKKCPEEAFDDLADFTDPSKRKAGLSAAQFECVIAASTFLPSEDSSLQDLSMFFCLELPTQARVCNWDANGDRVTNVNTMSTPARSARTPA